MDLNSPLNLDDTIFNVVSEESDLSRMPTLKTLSPESKYFLLNHILHNNILF